MSSVGVFTQDAPQRLAAFGSGRRVRTTPWTLVVAAGGDGEPARTALGKLYGLYWLPILSVIARRRGVEAARELAQEFFAQLVFRGDLKGVQRLPGRRFRSWLFTALRHFLTNQWHATHALCRDPDRSVSFDDAPGDSLPPSATVAARAPSAEEQLQRARVIAMLGGVLERLRREYYKNAGASGVDAERRFEAVKVFLPGPCTEDADYAECAASLGVAPDAVKQLVHRLRARFGQLLHEVIRDSVGSEAEVGPAKRALCQALEVSAQGGEAAQ